MAPRTEQILDHAEREMRKGGADAVSFRDIASAIGIKSASVHYHFPTKADLTAAVTRRYADRFLASLGSPADPSEHPRTRLVRLADAYIAAYETGGSTCLCTVLGAVSSSQTEQTQAEILSFYKRLREWTTRAMEGGNQPLTAGLVISLLQGAMVLARATSDTTPLEDARRLIAGDG